MPSDDNKMISASQVAVLAERVDQSNQAIAEMKGLMHGLIQSLHATSSQQSVTAEQITNLKKSVDGIVSRLEDGNKRFLSIDQEISRYNTLLKIGAASVTIVVAVVAWSFGRLDTLSNSDQKIRDDFGQAMVATDRRVTVLEMRLDGISPKNLPKEPK